MYAGLGYQTEGPGVGPSTSPGVFTLNIYSHIANHSSLIFLYFIFNNNL